MFEDLAAAASSAVNTIKSAVGSAQEAVNGKQRQPAYAISVDGVDITNVVNSRLMNLTVTDNRGFEADTVEITIDDGDGMVEIPPKGAKVRVAIGWSDTGTVDKGSFTVDEIEHSGAPDQLVIRARSADLRTGLTEKREQSWHDTTVGGVVTAIALRNDLQPALSSTLEPIEVAHFDQTNESDVNMLTRLADMHGAIAAVKDDHLLFMPAGLGQTASGKLLPVATIQRTDGDRHRFAVSDREAYAAVRANYFDVKQGKRGVVMVNEKTAKLLREQLAAKQRAANAHANSTDPAFTILHVYASKAKAIAGAKHELAKRVYTQVKASYVDTKHKQKGQVLVTNKTVKTLSTEKLKSTSGLPDALPATTDTANDPTFNDAGNVLTLRHSYATKDNAMRAARAAWDRLQRGLANFGITLAYGRPELMPEMPIKVVGFKPQIDAIDWTLTKVVHNLGDGGYTTQLELETKVDVLPD